MTLSALPTAWRARAEKLRRFAPAAAEAFADAAAELEAALAAAELEELTRAQAVEEFDVHPDTLTRLAREGRLPNVGRTHAPKYRRGDLARLGLPSRTPVGAVAPPATVASMEAFTRRVHGRKARG